MPLGVDRARGRFPPSLMVKPGVAREREVPLMDLKLMSVEDALEIALTAATHLTDLDLGAVAALRIVAKMLDDPEFPMVAGKFDNTSMGSFLKYSESLGLTPGGRGELVAGRKLGASPKDELAAFRSERGIG